MTSSWRNVTIGLNVGGGRSDDDRSGGRDGYGGSVDDGVGAGAGGGCCGTDGDCTDVVEKCDAREGVGRAVGTALGVVDDVADPVEPGAARWVWRDESVDGIRGLCARPDWDGADSRAEWWNAGEVGVGVDVGAGDLFAMSPGGRRDIFVCICSVEPEIYTICMVYLQVGSC